LTKTTPCSIINLTKGKEKVSIMEIIDFILTNAEFIVSYEVVNYSMDITIVEFTMVNGEKIEKIF
jgi:hypothetical protein